MLHHRHPIPIRQGSTTKVETNATLASARRIQKRGEMRLIELRIHQIMAPPTPDQPGDKNTDIGVVKPTPILILLNQSRHPNILHILGRKTLRPHRDLIAPVRKTKVNDLDPCLRIDQYEAWWINDRPILVSPRRERTTRGPRPSQEVLRPMIINRSTMQIQNIVILNANHIAHSPVQRVSPVDT